MAEPTITPSAPVTVATTNPSQGDPIIAKGFDDPVFLQAAEKAFAEAKVQRAKPSEPVQTDPAPQPEETPDKSTLEAPKIDRPPVPRKAAEWAEFHAAKTKVEKERDELKSRLDKFNGFDPKEYEDIKTERQKLSEKLEAIALERSDKFQEYFNSQKEDIKNLIKISVEDKADQVLELLELPNSKWRKEQLKALTEEMSPFETGGIVKAFADMDKLNIERNKVIENSSSNWKKLQEAEARERASQQEHMNNLFDREIRSMSDPEKGIAPFQTKDGDAAWNKSVKDRIEKARTIYAGDIPAEEKARYAAFSSALPEFERAFSETMKENAQLKEELGKLRSAEPGLEQGQRQTTGEKEYEGLGHGEALAKMIEKAGGFAGR
jgi:hypothetical protein